MSFNKKNIPFKQTMASNLLNTAMGAVNAAQTTMNQTSNASNNWNVQGNQGSWGGYVNTPRPGMGSAGSIQTPQNNYTSKIDPNSMGYGVFSKLPGSVTSAYMNVLKRSQQGQQNASANILSNYKYNTNNNNSMAYDNTAGTPRPVAPINPRAFSNAQNVQQLFGNISGYGSPLAQVQTDPLTGQQLDPLSSQSTTVPLPPPSGVQDDSIAPYYGLSN
jgi:hypothetical protein